MMSLITPVTRVSIQYSGAGPCADGTGHNKTLSMKIQNIQSVFNSFSDNDKSYY